jgi:hypothetical protein
MCKERRAPSRLARRTAAVAVEEVDSKTPLAAASEMRRNIPVKMNWCSGQTEYQ